MDEDVEIRTISFSAMVHQGFMTALLVVTGTAWTNAAESVMSEFLPSSSSAVSLLFHALGVTALSAACLRLLSWRSFHTAHPPQERRRKKRRKDPFRRVPSETVIASPEEAASHQLSP